MSEKHSKDNNPKVFIKENGPYLVKGNIPMIKQIIAVDEEGNAVKWEKVCDYPQKESYLLCRCGHSKNAPYCDGSHISSNFNGTETAENKTYLKEADRTEGPELDLTDNYKLCAGARFCEYKGGTWKLTKNSDNKESKELAIRETHDCPAGRLVIWDKKTGKPIEPELEQSISIVEDPSKNLSGPVWLKGGIPVVSSDSSQYEIRNRVTLCRCGKSNNKPFCDAAHLTVKFNDGDESLK
ncbi:MAG: CDGSH iron-sulfur domain-containing protein [Spirochaetes bacterium]|nr:CDGSH iron-sulfur domain-containing protein [Spirochaetota bacterium]